MRSAQRNRSSLNLNRQAALLLAAAAVLLLSLAYWRAISAYRAPYRLLQDQPVPAWVEQLYAWRWVVRGAMLAAGGGLVALELAGRAVSTSVKAVLSRPKWALALVLVLAAAGRSYLLAPGHIALIDGIHSMGNLAAVRAALAQGNWPPFFWSNYGYMGFPWYQFHNSLFYYEGGLIDLALRDAFLSLKVALLLNHGLAAALMFWYVRSLGRSAWAGLASAAVWSASFFHYHYFVHVGSAHLSLLIPLLPAMLLCAEAILNGRRAALAVAGLAQCLGLALWVHTFYGALCFVLLLAYSLPRLLSLPASVPSGRRVARAAWLAAALAVGTLAGLSQWLPQLAERELVGQWNRGLQFIQPDIGFEDILSFRQSFLTPDYYGGYVGLSVFAAAALCVLLGVALRDRRLAGLIGWLALAGYLSLGPRYLPFDELLHRLPFSEFVYAARYPGKYLIFAEFALAALAGLSVRQIGRSLGWLRRRLGRRPGSAALWTRRFALALAAAVSGEMIFLTLQVNSYYPEAWMGTEPGLKEGYEWLRANGDGASRLLNLGNATLEAAALSGQPSFAAHIEETPPATELYYWLAGSAIRDDIAAGRLQSTTRDGLYLLDVGYVMLVEAPPPDGGWAPGYAGSPFSVWRVPEHSPAVAAPRLERVEAGAEFDSTIEAMRLRREANAAEHIPVVNLPAGGSPVGQAGPLDLQIEGYQVHLASMVLEYEISQPAFLQLGYSAYPYLRAYLDGEPHEYFWTAFNLVGLATPAGAHRLELRPFLSPLRVAAYWLDALGLLAILALAFAALRRPTGRPTRVLRE